MQEGVVCAHRFNEVPCSRSIRRDNLRRNNTTRWLIDTSGVNLDGEKLESESSEPLDQFCVCGVVRGCCFRRRLRRNELVRVSGPGATDLTEMRETASSASPFPNALELRKVAMRVKRNCLTANQTSFGGGFGGFKQAPAKGTAKQVPLHLTNTQDARESSLQSIEYSYRQ